MLKVLKKFFIIPVMAGIAVLSCNPSGGGEPFLKEATLIIEHNATDEDTGFQGAIDTEGFKRLTLTDSEETEMLQFDALESLGDLGVTEIFFESVEPENSEVPIDETLENIPEGLITIEGTQLGGTTLSTTKDFTHTIPMGPELIAPAEDAELAPGDIEFSWNAVTTDLDSENVDIIAYELIVENADYTNTNMAGKMALSLHLSPSVTSVTVPAAFFQSATNYSWEVLAVEKSGNQTLSSSTFKTTGAPEILEVEEPFMKWTTLIIEHNATDEDTGFQGFIDTEGYKELTITNPDDEVILDFNALGNLSELGITETFFETVEPENAVVSIENTLAKMPAGTYTFTGIDVDDVIYSATKVFTHTIPKGPQLLTPAAEMELPLGSTTFSWNAVTEDLDDNPVNIIAYQLLVLKLEKPVNMVGKMGLDMRLPAAVTSITLPAEFLETGDYEWEVLAVEESGNQTLSSGEFTVK